MCARIGTAKRPVVVLLDVKELRDNEDCRHQNAVYCAWKASFMGLLHGFGFGMAVLDIMLDDLCSLARHTEMWYEGGDKMVTFCSSQVPVSLDAEWVGLEVESELYIVRERPNSNELFDSMMITHRHLLCLVLEHELRFSRPDSAKVAAPVSEDMSFVSKVCCQFGIRIPKRGGMRDFLCIVHRSCNVQGVEREKGMLRSKKLKVPEDSREGWDGWHPSPNTASKCRQNGTFVIYTVLPSCEGELSKVNVENTGVFFTVPERVVRCFTERQGGEGMYYEYVAALDPKNRCTVRTMFLTVGSSIVLPVTFAVRIGGHDSLAIQVVGCVIAVEPSAEDGFCFYPNDRVEKVRDLYEYDADTELLEAKRMKHAAVVPSSVLTKKTSFVIGSIPTLLSIELNNSFRKQLIDNMYDMLPGRSSLSEVYEMNPILRVDGHSSITHTIQNNYFSAERQVLMGLSGTEQWIMTDVPFDQYRKLQGKAPHFPLNLLNLRKRLVDQNAAARSVSSQETVSNTNEQCVSGEPKLSPEVGKKSPKKTLVGHANQDNDHEHTEESVSTPQKEGTRRNVRRSSRKRRRNTIVDDEEDSE